MTAPAASPMASVIHNGVCLGFVFRRHDAVEAFTAELVSIGLFETERAAVVAVMERRPAP